MKRVVFLLLVLFSAKLASAQITQKSITEVSAEEMQKVQVLDVRTPEEFKKGHLPKAININWFDPNFIAQVQKLNKQKTVYVYCHAGGRSAKAAHVLDSLGFAKITDLNDGYRVLLPPKEER